MGAIHTDRLRPGLILAEDVQDINGRLLLTKGQVIQPKHIRIFKIWGISEVNIIDDAQSNAELQAEGHTENIEQVENVVKTVFSHTDLEHPAIREIFKLAVSYRSTQNEVEADSNIDLKECAIPEEDREKDFFNRLSQKKIILPEIPSIVFELNEVIANPVSSVEEIAQVVNRSPSLTALLLKIVNSSFYGFPSKIIKISHAVTLIGTREISGLALGISILSIFKKIPKEIIDMYSFLKHSLACGILSRILAANINFPQTEQLFVSGLLHDLGRLIFYIYFPEESRNVLSRSRTRCNLLFEEETDYLGCNHAQIGTQLLKQWKLPLVLENNVFYHHSPSEAQQPIPAALVHLSDIIVNALGIGSSGEKFVPPLDNRAWEELELTPSCFETVIGQGIHQFYGLETILQA
ncbi:MAG: HDOD domain-containing protein [Desulfobacterales bacterium]|jgi:putative nucleotidyltransferase with HDIG domain